MISFDEARVALEALENAGVSAGCAFANLSAYIDQHQPVEHSGDWIQTFGGGRFYPLNPRIEDVNLNDIARALSRICRFAGHCEQFYSVAQHSVYVSGLVPPEYALVALLHDATEAYLVDVPRPLKNALPAYREIENRVWFVIADAFGLPTAIPDCVKEADNRVLLAEKNQLLKPGDDWGFKEKPAPIQIQRMTDDQAYLFFLNRFQFIMHGMRS